MNQPTDTPQVMQAVAIARFGGLETLENTRLPVPSIGPNEVLIRVHTAGIGEWDPFEREGGYAKMMGLTPSFPYVLGSEGSGVIAAVGSRVERLAVGDRVYAASFLNPKGGFYAQYTAVDEGQVSRIPGALTLEQAGVMSGVASTALRGLEDKLRLARGESILIAGASGGLGHTAIQLAKRMGARVFAIASHADGVALALRLGADAAVDGREDHILTGLREFAPGGVDAALLAANGGTITEALSAIRDGGRLAYPTGVQPEPELRASVRVEQYNGEPDRDLLERLDRRIAAGPFTVHIARTFPLAEAAAAQRALGEHHLGKLALRIE
jgi:NADPH:quinone reductase